MPSFKVVFVPQDSARPMEEREVAYTEATKVSCLMDMARDHFRTVLPKDAEQDRKVFHEQVMAQAKAKGYDMPEGDPNGLVDKLMDVQMVDTVAVQLNHPQVDNIAVTMYVDDRAVAKGVEVNDRASRFCIAAGWQQAVLGDAFVARARDDNNDLFDRLDFSLADLSSDATWMAGARKLNAQRTQPNPDPTAGGASVHRHTAEAASKYDGMPTAERLELAARRRVEGNDFFRDGDLDAAAEAYQEALVLLELVSTEVAEGPARPPGGAAASAEAAATAASAAAAATGESAALAAAATAAAAAAPTLPAAASPAPATAVATGAGGANEAPSPDAAEQALTRVAVHNNMALVRAKQGRWEDSAIHASRALALDADNTKALFRRGKAKQEQGMLRDAARDLGRAHTLAPKDKSIRKAFAAVSAKLKEKGKSKGFKAGGIFS